MTNKKLVNTNLNMMKGGALVDPQLVNRITETLLGFDRMKVNPDAKLIREVVKDMLDKTEMIRFVIFACPDFKPKALLTECPEDYMPVEVKKDDLFEPRIPKLKELRSQLWELGISSCIDVFIGDNDITECLQETLDIKLDAVKLLDRQRRYLKSFERRMQKEFGQLFTVWSFADLGVVIQGIPSVSALTLKGEITFFKWLFSNKGPYTGLFNPNPSALVDMAMKTFALYGAQGLVLGELFSDYGGALLLRTGRPDDWLQGTLTFRCMGGGTRIPAIYPYIRKEDLERSDIV